MRPHISTYTYKVFGGNSVSRRANKKSTFCTPFHHTFINSPLIYVSTKINHIHTKIKSLISQNSSNHIIIFRLMVNFLIPPSLHSMYIQRFKQNNVMKVRKLIIISKYSKKHQVLLIKCILQNYCYYDYPQPVKVNKNCLGKENLLVRLSPFKPDLIVKVNMLRDYK